jgi:hypothetical protein
MAEGTESSEDEVMNDERGTEPPEPNLMNDDHFRTRLCWSVRPSGRSIARGTRSTA